MIIAQMDFAKKTGTSQLMGGGVQGLGRLHEKNFPFEA
jgi:hypothetical protein